MCISGSEDGVNTSLGLALAVQKESPQLLVRHFVGLIPRLLRAFAEPTQGEVSQVVVYAEVFLAGQCNGSFSVTMNLKSPNAAFQVSDLLYMWGNVEPSAPSIHPGGRQGHHFILPVCLCLPIFATIHLNNENSSFQLFMD